MSTGRYDLEDVTAGETATATFTWDDDAANPQPADLTGYTARMTMRARPGVEVTATSAGGGGLTLGGNAGTITLELAPATTALLGVARWWEYDLRLVSAAGAVTYLLEGLINVRPAITTPGA